MQLTESGVVRLIKSTYHLLNLITYFTAGVQEVRAWTITKGMLAPQAAGLSIAILKRALLEQKLYNTTIFRTTDRSEAACRIK